MRLQLMGTVVQAFKRDVQLSSFGDVVSIVQSGADDGHAASLVLLS
jgi:hypothetical protein